jgi:hypothetical protein
MLVQQFVQVLHSLGNQRVRQIRHRLPVPSLKTIYSPALARRDVKES